MSTLPWPGLSTCLSLELNSDIVSFEKEPVNKQQSSTKAKVIKPKKKNKENDIVCDYCDKTFDVRTFDTTSIIIHTGGGAHWALM